ncbi:putative spermidine/putrescine transport system permease protein [Bosea sp. OK403]|uniref:ABC transporter permease n=1 Tax=Bosea sp. OK403 TaxID=1855286 RepID=UPI0008E1EB85|nr:ABC transporter permease [Bosea sp. OK403]SFJ73053.1 putative spermidine/putrescine transport system permease protein [Bosea sp. OK403]
MITTATGQRTSDVVSSPKPRPFAPFIWPAVAVILLVLTWPIVATIVQAFTFKGQFGVDHIPPVLNSRLFRVAFWNTIIFGLQSAFIAAIVAYPLAVYASTLGQIGRSVVMILVLLPFWTSILVKSFSLIVILGDQGIVRNAISALVGSGNAPTLIMNHVGVVIAMVHAFIPYLFFPILANLLNQDKRLRHAAFAMGASRFRAFWSVTFPLSFPSVCVGIVLSFILSLGYFVTPQLVGGRSDITLGVLIDYYTRETLNWSAASLSAIVLLLTGIICILAMSLIPNAGSLPLRERR